MCACARFSVPPCVADSAEPIVALVVARNHKTHGLLCGDDTLIKRVSRLLQDQRRLLHFRGGHEQHGLGFGRAAMLTPELSGRAPEMTDFGGFRILGNDTHKNMTNSTPAHFQEDDARWCYVEHHVEVCVRLVLCSC